jgi:hypothetical protein
MPDLDEPLVTPQRRRDGVAAGATVVVVLALVVAYFLTRDDDEPGPTEKLLSSLTPEGPQACRAGDLIAGKQTKGAAAGTTYLTATLQLADGVEPCFVDGYPQVVVLNNGRPGGVGTVVDDSLGHVERLTVLPDRPVKLTLAWAVSHYCGPIVADTIRLYGRSGLTLDIAGFGPTSCNPGEGRPPVRVGAFTYVDPVITRGTVAGIVALNGGPAPGTGEYVTSGAITFESDSGGYSASIAEDGSFEIEMPAGEYGVTIRSPQWNSGAGYSYGRFDVLGGELNQLNVILPVR